MLNGENLALEENLLIAGWLWPTTIAYPHYKPSLTDHFYSLHISEHRKTLINEIKEMIKNMKTKKC